jgi:2-oxoglutarate ferredoxin oxidoreductase subunit delta
MAKVRGAVVVNQEGCKGCELCVVACPQDVLALNMDVNSRGYHYSYMKNPEACIGCSNCGVVCPDTCLTIYRVSV